MNEIQKQAIEKIESASGIQGKKEVIMLGAVKSALKLFCAQSEEFAEAVAQGGTMQECMTAIAKGTGNAISDEEVYAKAVQFFFRGAWVKFQMTIMMAGDEDNTSGTAVTPPLSGEARESEAESKEIIIDIASFL